MAKKGPKTPHAANFKKGQSGNPGGLTKEQREARDKIREALKGEADEVHAALLDLVRERNPQVVMYAHQVLHGKEPDRSEVSIKGGSAELLKGMTSNDVASLVSGLEDHRRSLIGGEGSGMGSGRALVPSGQEPDGPARGALVKS